MVIIKKILFNDALQWRGTTYQHSRYNPRQLDPVMPEVCSQVESRVFSGRDHNPGQA